MKAFNLWADAHPFLSLLLYSVLAVTFVPACIALGVASWMSTANEARDQRVAAHDGLRGVKKERGAK